MTGAIGFTKDDYLRAWIDMLHTFLGWGSERVLQWAEQYENDFNDGEFRRHTPVSYVAPVLVPDQIKQALTRAELAYLENWIHAAIEHGDSGAGFKEDFDWSAAKRRVLKVLKKYEAKISMVPCAGCRERDIQIKYLERGIHDLMRRLEDLRGTAK